MAYPGQKLSAKGRIISGISKIKIGGWKLATVPTVIVGRCCEMISHAV
jgi:hypothetical protein